MGVRTGLAVWGMASVALGLEAHLGVRIGLGVIAGVLALVVGVATRLAWMGRLSLRVRDVQRPLAMVGATLVITIGVVTWRVVPLVDGPLAPLAGTSSVIDADVTMTTDPQPRAGRTSGSRRSDDSWQFDATTSGWQTSAGGRVDAVLPVRVITTADVAALLPGTAVRVQARVLPADPVHGRAATLVARSAEVMAPAPAWQEGAGAVRASLRASVRDRPVDEAGLLPGLVVGDTSGVPDDLDVAMRASSLAHLTAVSGGNVAVVVLLAVGLVRLCGVHRGRLQVLLVAAAVGTYVVIARPQPSVVRAAGMVAVVLGALLLDLRVTPRAALGWSVAALVLVDPFLSLSVGFAMSVVATGALVELAARATPYAAGRHRVIRAMIGVVLVSAAAQVAVAPLVVGLGGGIPVGGVVANLLAEPAVGPATSFGLAAAFVGLASPPAAVVIALPASWAVGWIAVVARTTADLAPPLPWPSGWGGGALLLGVLTLGAVGAVVARRAGGRVARACAAVAAAGLVVALVPSTPAVPGASAWPPPGWRVVLCDVGQGDAVALRAAPGEAVVVDTGPDPAAADRCLRRLGIVRVPVVVLTHFHADHVEGVPGVLRGRTVGLVVTSPLLEPVSEDHRVAQWLRAESVPMRVAAPGDVLTVGDVQLRVVWPTKILRGQGSDPNNASVAMIASVAGTSVLLDGDLETAAQEAVLASGVVGHVDVVKVPHHGSAKQSAGWATATRPLVALIGVGLDNDYGHPYPGTVAAYRNVGAMVGRTDLDGDVAVLVDDQGRLGVVRRGR